MNPFPTESLKPTAGMKLSSSFWLERVMYFGVIASLLVWISSSVNPIVVPFQFPNFFQSHNLSSSSSSPIFKQTQKISLQQSKPTEISIDLPLPDPRVGQPITNWNATRRQWLNLHPTLNNRRDRILMITGSQPSPCSSPVGDHYLLRLFKNKVDYCRINNCQIFYNNANLQHDMPGYWAKYPVIRAAMITHPEVEWIWWVDSDAVITDMSFKPFLQSRYKNYNLIVQGWSELIYGEHKSWYGANAGVFFIRNCQWSMDLMEEWSNMGPISPDYPIWGSRQKSVFPDKLFPESDDQTGLLYLLVTENAKWADKVYIEENMNDFQRTGPVVADLKNKTLMAKWYKGLEIRRQPEYLRGSRKKGKRRRPFIIHFTGCQPCQGDHNLTNLGGSCLEGMESVLNFADNQVLLNYGYVRPDLLSSSHIEPLPGL